MHIGRIPWVYVHEVRRVYLIYTIWQAYNMKASYELCTITEYSAIEIFTPLIYLFYLNFLSIFSQSALVLLWEPNSADCSFVIVYDFLTCSFNSHIHCILLNYNTSFFSVKSLTLESLPGIPKVNPTIKNEAQLLLYAHTLQVVIRDWKPRQEQLEQKTRRRQAHTSWGLQLVASFSLYFFFLDTCHLPLINNSYSGL